MQLASVLSLGRIVDAVARAGGWSPAGREIVLHDAEGPDANLFEGLSGKVTSFDGEGITLACNLSSGVSAEGPRLIQLTPRHVGWTAFSLMLCDVAVIATAQDEKGRDAQTIAVATLSRGARARRPSP